MEILSFVLGMSMALVFTLCVVAVIGFFKARKNEKELEKMSTDVYQQIDHIDFRSNRRITELEQDIHRQLDSRLDRLENKLTDTIKNGCEPVKLLNN